MPEHSIEHAASEEWASNRFWDRMRSGFQDTLRRMWSEKSPETTPESLTKQPALPNSEHGIVPSPASSQEFLWTLVLSDTDNDFRSVLRVLWLTGLCDQNGCWTPDLQNIQVIHTGDWLNKWDPNPHVLDGFKRLQESVPEGCRFVLLNGNHELSILQMADKGLRTPLTPNDLAFIQSQSLIHCNSGILYLHGYPSTELLSILKQFHRDALPAETFNDHLRAQFFEGSSPLFQESQSLRLIGDVKNPRAYFNQKSQNGISRGKYAASLLQEMGFDTVIHGHKPNAEIQVDHELQEEIPGIRLINNDNRIRVNEVGGVLISHQNYAIFINPQALRDAGSDKVLRKKLRKLLGTRWKDLHPKEKRRLRQDRDTKVKRLAA